MKKEARKYILALLVVRLTHIKKQISLPPALSLIFVIILFSFTNSCTKSNKAIPIRLLDLSIQRVQKNIPLSQFTNSIEYTYLEDTPESYIGKIATISITKNYILISDKILQRVLLFEKSGKFIRQIGEKGKGPGEYITIFACNIDKEEKIVYIYTIGDQILQYSVDGKFMKSIKIRNGKILNFKPLSKGIVFSVGFPNSLLFGNCSFGAVDYNGNLIDMYLKRNLPKKIPETALLGNNNFYSYGDTTCFWEYIYDTIFGLTNDLELIPRWQLKYDNSNRVQPRSFYSLDLLNKEKIDGKFIVSNLIETTNYFFLSVLEQRRRKQLIFDKTTKSLIELPTQPRMIDDGIKNDIDNGINFWPQFGIDENNLIACIDPNQLIEIMHENSRKLPIGLAEIANIVTEKSNFILMIINLKQ